MDFFSKNLEKLFASWNSNRTIRHFASKSFRFQNFDHSNLIMISYRFVILKNSSKQIDIFIEVIEQKLKLKILTKLQISLNIQKKLFTVRLEPFDKSVTLCLTFNLTHSPRHIQCKQINENDQLIGSNK